MSGSHSNFQISRSLLPLLLGVALTLTLRGYQFGGGNHSVYLIAPLREVYPELLANDWWTMNTLQYHLAYTRLTAALMRLGIVEPAFLVFYLSLTALLHGARLRIVLALGLDARTYLFSVLLYYLSAGGTGLGSYQFLQDSSFLPGNVANVAMLWGIAFFIDGKLWPCAGALALAGLFHLNHALVALALWMASIALQQWRSRSGRGSILLAGGLILLLSLPNLIPAARLALAGLPRMPLKEFVDLYVHLRHPHHYDPLAWPIGLWLSFLWPIPLAVLAYKHRPVADSSRRAALLFTFLLALQLIAFLFAGVIFISESLIQMSLFRFSIYPKLLSCIGAAAFLLDPALLARRSVRIALLLLPALALIAMIIIRLTRPASTAGAFVQANLPALLLFIALIAASLFYILRSSSILHPPSSILILLLLGVLFLAWNRWLGVRIFLQDASDGDYLAVCAWARANTPAEAVFLVPPNEQLFRFHAQRAIIVNFKNVPQLSHEMFEWKQRLETVLDQPLSALPRRFDRAHEAIAARYDTLPAEHFRTVARRYGARYLLTTRPLPGQRPLFEKPPYHLYDLAAP